MAKHTETIPWQFADELFECVCLSVFGHFVGLAFKGLDEKNFTAYIMAI